MIDQTQTTLERMVKPGREGWVYLIQAEGSNRCKIGRSVNPAARHQTLQKQSPFPLTIIDSFWTLDAISDEAYLHEICQKERVYGEWFEFPDPIKSLFYLARGGWASNIKTSLYESHFNFLCYTLEQHGFNEHQGCCGTLFTLYDYAEARSDFEFIDKVIHEIIPARLTSECVDFSSLNVPAYITGILDGIQFCLTGYKKEFDE